MIIATLLQVAHSGHIFEYISDWNEYPPTTKIEIYTALSVTFAKNHTPSLSDSYK